MPWIKFPTWDRWGELTRFRIAIEAASAAEHSRWETLPIENPAAVTIADPVDGSDFRCSLEAYKTALSSTHQLYSMLLGAYAGLIEEHGRSLIEYALSVKHVPRTAFQNISLTNPADEAAEDYIRSMNVEFWGQRYLDLKERSWNDVGGGKAGVVEAIALRNITSHGLRAINTKAFNRMTAAGCDITKWPVGKDVTLNRPTFNECLQNLRAFGRVLSDIAAIL